MLVLNELPVWYINLDQHVEKRERLEAWLTEKGFTDINRWPGVNDPRPGLGCARAHNTLLAHLANVEPPYLVLEDDVKPWAWRNRVKVPADADAYYLGLSPYGLRGNKGYKTAAAKKIGTDTWRLYNMLAAHAIIYFNTDYVRWLHRATQTMIDLKTNQDKARAQTMKYWNVYGPDKAYVYQDGKHRVATKVNMNDITITEPLSLI